MWRVVGIETVLAQNDRMKSKGKHAKVAGSEVCKRMCAPWPTIYNIVGHV